GQGRLALHGFGQARGPPAQVGDVVALQGELVGAVALAPAHAQVLHRIEEQADAGDARQLRPQPRDHGLAALGPVGGGLEVDEDETAAGSRRMMLTSWRSFSCMAWNEMLWSARMPPWIWPVSCCGK